MDPSTDPAVLSRQYSDDARLRIRVEAHRLYSERSDSFLEWVLERVAVEPGVVWRPAVKVGFKPPGTTTYGLVTLTITNLTHTSQKVALTQIWLRNAAGAPYLAAATANVPRNLFGLPIPAGKSVTGTLVYPAPQRETGYLLVYRFADAKAIAKAKHVGLLAYS